MTTLAMRKANKEELQVHIDGEIAAYRITFQGRDSYLDNYGRITTTDHNKYGAVIAVSGNALLIVLAEVQSKIEAGYRIDTSGIYIPVCNPVKGGNKFYLVKPEAEQAIDIAAITKEATANYEAELEAHNDRVYAQELAALKAEEAAIAAQLRAEDEARAASDLERRVRERMRGSKAPAKKEAV